MARYEVTIPGWRPAFTNELMGRHFGTIAGRKNRDVRQLAVARLVSGAPVATGRRRVSLAISGRYSTFPDPDAPEKSFFDALKRSGWIVDDGAEWLDFDWPPRFVRGPKQTTIIVEDAADG